MSDRPRRRSDEPPARPEAEEDASAHAQVAEAAQVAQVVEAAEAAEAAQVAEAAELEAEQSALSSADGPERRSYERFDVTWAVDCQTEDTFLYAWIANISAMGIFVRTTEPLPVGTRVTLRFSPREGLVSSDDPTVEPVDEIAPGPFVLVGVVQWVNPVRPLHDNPNPGMGVAFVNLTPDDRERLVHVIHTIAYLRDAIPN